MWLPHDNLSYGTFLGFCFALPLMPRICQIIDYLKLFKLPIDYSWQTLRDRLGGFGDIEFADIVQPGTGKVRFALASDAENATGIYSNAYFHVIP